MRTLSILLASVFLLVNTASAQQFNFVVIATQASPDGQIPAKIILSKPRPEMQMQHQLTRAVSVQPYQYDMMSQQMNAKVAIEVRNNWLDNQDIRVKMIALEYQADPMMVPGMLGKPQEDLEFVNLDTFLADDGGDLLSLDQYMKWLSVLAS